MTTQVETRNDPLSRDATAFEVDGRSLALLSDNRERYFAQSSRCQNGSVPEAPPPSIGLAVFAKLFPLSAGVS